MTERLPAQDVRQGQRGRPVLFVLLASLALLVVALFGLVTWQGAMAPKDYASLSQDSARQLVTGSTTGRTSAPASGETRAVPDGDPASLQPGVRAPN